MRPKRPTVYDLNVLGVQFYRSEAYDLAIVQLEQAVRLAPESPGSTSIWGVPITARTAWPMPSANFRRL